MKKESKANHPFERVEVSRDEALAMANGGEVGALCARSEPSKFKIDIIENIPADETISPSIATGTSSISAPSVPSC